MPCGHLTDIEPIEPNTFEECEDWLKIGGQRVHLRLCMQYSHVGYGDNSPKQHATGHFHGAGHGVISRSNPASVAHSASSTKTWSTPCRRM